MVSFRRRPKCPRQVPGRAAGRKHWARTESHIPMVRTVRDCTVVRVIGDLFPSFGYQVPSGGRESRRPSSLIAATFDGLLER